MQIGKKPFTHPCFNVNVILRISEFRVPSSEFTEHHIWAVNKFMSECFVISLIRLSSGSYLMCRGHMLNVIATANSTIQPIKVANKFQIVAIHFSYEIHSERWPIHFSKTKMQSEKRAKCQNKWKELCQIY